MKAKYLLSCLFFFSCLGLTAQDNMDVGNKNKPSGFVRFSGGVSGLNTAPDPVRSLNSFAVSLGIQHQLSNGIFVRMPITLSEYCGNINSNTGYNFRIKPTYLGIGFELLSVNPKISIFKNYHFYSSLGISYERNLDINNSGMSNPHMEDNENLNLVSTDIIPLRLELGFHRADFLFNKDTFFGITLSHPVFNLNRNVVSNGFANYQLSLGIHPWK